MILIWTYITLPAIPVLLCAADALAPLPTPEFLCNVKMDTLISLNSFPMIIKAVKSNVSNRSAQDRKQALSVPYAAGKLIYYN